MNGMLWSVAPVVLLALLALGAWDNAAAAAPPSAQVPPDPPPPTNLSFYHTADSDDWVRHCLIVQQEYSRVLLVSSDANAPKTVDVAALDLNASEAAGAATGPTHRYDVAQVFPTLQAAADASRGGDLIAVMPGKYSGFVIKGARPEVGDGRYIHFKAMGQPGDVIIDQPAEVNRAWMIFLTSTHHIIIEGFNIDGRAFAAETPADPSRFRLPATAPSSATTRRPRRSNVDWAGIMLGAGFHETGLETHHIIVLNNFSHDHGSWGMHSTDTHTVLVQGNLFAFSRREHGCYVSDGSDDYVIRRNVFFGNSACGLQCNLDANASLRRLWSNPRMRDIPPRQGSISAWSQNLLKVATQRFGEYNFPDGRGLNFIIERNVSCGNGKLAGGAFNFSGLQQSLVQNNLLYDNHAHGMAFYGQAQFDDEFFAAGIHSVSQVTGPEVLPFFASHDNIARNNTVVMSSPGRAAAILVGGSYGCTLRNNIFINDADDSVHADSFSLWKMNSDYNVVGKVGYSAMVPEGFWTKEVRARPTPLPENLKGLALQLDDKGHSVTGLTGPTLASHFVRYEMQPWVIVEGSWWRLNPDRPDFHPKADSTLLSGKGDLSNLPPADADGKLRNAADIGAFAVAP